LAREFSAIGIEVKTASNSSEGIELVDQGDQTWVVLLDVLMPGLSGLAGIKVFKSKPNVQDVISISGLDAQTWEPRAVGAGATLFLSKNSTSLEIFKKIQPLLQLAQPSESVVSNV
jgi:CheY-like chemotaxis protein